MNRLRALGLLYPGAGNMFSCGHPTPKAETRGGSIVVHSCMRAVRVVSCCFRISEFANAIELNRHATCMQIRGSVALFSPIRRRI